MQTTAWSHSHMMLWSSWIAAIFTSCLFGISIELEVKFMTQSTQLVLLLNCFWWMLKTALLLDRCSPCSNAIHWIWGVLMYVLITALLQLEAKLSSDSTGSATHPINNTTSAVFDRCTGLWGIHHSCTLIPSSETFLEYFWCLHLVVDHLKWLVYSCLDVWHMCTCRTLWLTHLWSLTTEVNNQNKNKNKKGYQNIKLQFLRYIEFFNTLCTKSGKLHQAII